MVNAYKITTCFSTGSGACNFCFKSELFEYMEANHNDLFETIRTTKDLPDEDELKKAIGEFRDSYKETLDAQQSKKERIAEMVNAQN